MYWLILAMLASPALRAETWEPAPDPAFFDGSFEIEADWPIESAERPMPAIPGDYWDAANTSGEAPAYYLVAQKDSEFYSVVLRKTGKCVEALKGELALLPCHSGEGQLWRLVRAREGKFSFVQKQSGLCLSRSPESKKLLEQTRCQRAWVWRLRSR